MSLLQKLRDYLQLSPKDIELMNSMITELNETNESQAKEILDLKRQSQERELFVVELEKKLADSLNKLNEKKDEWLN
jgi:hypothetical protein